MSQHKDLNHNLRIASVHGIKGGSDPAGVPGIEPKDLHNQETYTYVYTNCCWGKRRRKEANVPKKFRLEQRKVLGLERMAGTTGLEPATSDVTGRRSNQLNYVPF